MHKINAVPFDQWLEENALSDPLIPDDDRPPVHDERERGRGKKPARFERINTDVLMAMEFEPIRWIIPGYVPEGFSVLAGRQKLGKTWMAIDMALAVASGGLALGAIDVEQGDVLYIDLENGQRRAQRRVDTFYPSEKSRPKLPRLEWVNKAPNLSDEFLAALDEWRLSVANPRLVVIDVLQRIKPAGNAARNSYENDYTIWSPLQHWATENGIAVLGLHHTKKGGADDPLEALSGSNGLSACADTTLVLDRDGNGTTLYVRGRDVDEKESALDFTDGLWSLKGDAAAVRRTTERNAILHALLDADEPLTPAQIADAADQKRNNVDRLLGKMAKAGEVKKAKRGRYIHPDRTDLTAAENGAVRNSGAFPTDGGAPGKNGKKVRNFENTNNFNGLEEGKFHTAEIEPVRNMVSGTANPTTSYLRTDLTATTEDDDDRLLQEVDRLNPDIRAEIDGGDRARAQEIIDDWREVRIPHGADTGPQGLLACYEAARRLRREAAHREWMKTASPQERAASVAAFLASLDDPDPSPAETDNTHVCDQCQLPATADRPLVEMSFREVTALVHDARLCKAHWLTRMEEQAEWEE